MDQLKLALLRRISEIQEPEYLEEPKLQSKSTQQTITKARQTRSNPRQDTQIRTVSRGRASQKANSPNFTPDALEVTRLACTRAFSPDKSARILEKRESIPPPIRTRRKKRQEIDAPVIGTAYKTFVATKLPAELLFRPTVKPKLKVKAMNQTTYKFPTIDKPKSKPIVEITPEDLYYEFIRKLQLSNGLKLGPSETKYYKFFIGPGNNSQMVRLVLRRRWWWVPTGSMKHCHFVWTSHKHKKTLNRLPPCDANDQATSITKQRHVRTSPQVGHDLILASPHFKMIECSSIAFSHVSAIYNKISQNKHICSKKGLFASLKAFYADKVFDVVPVTLHIEQGKGFDEFEAMFEKDSIWIVKPGENSNRGKGILVTSSLPQIKSFIQGQNHTYIIQKYITEPLLIDNRKFDIRCFGLITIINGHIQGYFYKEGYIRTSSYEFSLRPPFCKYVHLTNDAVQKRTEEYGRYEPGNKMSYKEFQVYCDENQIKINVENDVVEKMKLVVGDTIKASYLKLDPSRLAHTFELIGYDFMVDASGKVWLIEANTNPCLEQSSAYLEKLLPQLIENTFMIALDPLFPPPAKSRKVPFSESFISNKYELVFSS